MKKSIILLFVLIPLLSFAKPFKVIGYYANKPNGTIIAYLNDRGQKVVIKNHRFKIIGDIPSTTGMYINNLPVIWIEPTTQYVNINKDHVTVKGSKTQDESVIFDSLRKDIKTPERSAQLIRTFSSEHSSSIIPAYELYFLIINEELKREELCSLFQSFTENVKQSITGKECKKLLDKQALTLPGCKAPYFSSAEGSPYWLDKDPRHRVTLDDYKGKVLLIDFWAYWCGPCREGIPVWKEFYNQHHQDGFEVLAVNNDFDMNKGKWQKAIKEEGTQMWHQINCLDSWNYHKQDSTDISTNYFVQAIPRYVLIDRNGIILGTWVGSSEHNYSEIKQQILEALKKL